MADGPIFLELSFSGGYTSPARIMHVMRGGLIWYTEEGGPPQYVPGGDTATVKLLDRSTWMLLRPRKTTWWPHDNPAWYSGTFSGDTFSTDNGAKVFQLAGWEWPSIPGHDYVFRPLWAGGGVPPQGTGHAVLTDALFVAAQRRCEEIRQEIIALLAEAGVTAGSMFDPTGLSSLGLSAYDFHKGDWVGGTLNLLGGLPVVGEFLGRMPRTAALTARLAEAAKELDTIIQALRETEAIQRAVPEIAAASSRLSRATVNFTSRLAATTRRMNMARLAQLEHLWASGARTPIEIERDLAEIPALKNPRLLAKHGEDFELAKLEPELRQKGFLKVKEGAHDVRVTGRENSDIWVRKIVGHDGKEYWEFVRQDIRHHTVNKLPGGPPGTATRPPFMKNGNPVVGGPRQAADRPFRQEHLGAAHWTTPETAVQRADALNAGNLQKGDFTHWHHVLVPRDPPGNLANYLGANTFQNVRGPITKLDFTGRSVGTREVKAGLKPVGP